MGSVADIVRDDSTDVPTSTTSFTVFLPLQRSHHVWNQPAFCDPMGNVTLVPWKCGQLLVWDTTCLDTFTPSYRQQATSAAGKIAAAAEESKAGKYAHLDQVYMYVCNPVTIETSGVLGPHTAAFLKELGRRIHQETGEAKSSAYLLKCLSVAVQRGECSGCDGNLQPSLETLPLFNYITISFFM